MKEGIRLKSAVIVVLLTILSIVDMSGMSMAKGNERNEWKAYKNARNILGEDLITPEEVSAVFGFIYTKKQQAYFEETLPSENILHWAKENGYAVIAGPPTPMNILTIHAFRPKFFATSWSQEEPWYIEESFAKNDHVATRWVLIKKEPIKDSTNKYFIDQMGLLADDEYIPNTAEISWSIVVFFEINKKRLFERVYTRTSSMISNGNHVIVGFFGPQGMVIHSYWDFYRIYGIGLTAIKHY